MNRLQYIIVSFLLWALAIELVGLLGYNLIANGAFSLSPSIVPGTPFVIIFFVALFGGAVITRRIVRRRTMRGDWR